MLTDKEQELFKKILDYRNTPNVKAFLEWSPEHPEENFLSDSEIESLLKILINEHYTPSPKWEDMKKCSKCKYVIAPIMRHAYNNNYCPYCGPMK